MVHDFPNNYYQLFSAKKDFVLLETSKYDMENYRTFLFIDPVEILQIYSVDEVPELFQKIDHYLSKGYYLAGYFAYECGYHFEKISPKTTFVNPIAWLGIYHQPIIFNHLTGVFEFSAEVLNSDPNGSCFLGESKLSKLRFNISKPDYLKKIKQIEDFILQGDTYQINFTGKYDFVFDGSIFALYNSLKNKQNVAYGALIKADSRYILCFSPELFFRLKNGKITTKPMKGTAKRGKTDQEDLLIQEWLEGDKKNRAENLMIVDLLRNDLGRISEIGSVKVRDLFSVEKYQTLFQMTSTIEAKVRAELNYYEIFKSIFPCGSVTGAPKIRSMQIIDELETSNRGVYTGAIGYFSPQREAIFNVAIRTPIISGNKGEMGVGSGIVYDSISKNEYTECQLKAHFLSVEYQEFELLETILWDKGYRLLENHIERINLSGKYFDYQLEVDSLIFHLMQNDRQLKNGTKYKVRLKINRYGEATIENSIIEECSQSKAHFVLLSDQKTDSNDILLYHKTTNRHFYDRMFQKALDEGCADMIFLNEKNQVTEGAISNIFIENNGCLITPPVECGLLNGVYRRYLLKERPNTIEKIITVKDLKAAEAIYICNSIRGLRRVRLKV
jgi:para-aminobenzoate synthetase / 4-amino-4-deoxychorismate lyase